MIAQRRVAEVPIGVRRLNWGCGGHFAEGWINCDRSLTGPHVHMLCDIVSDGIPATSDSFDYAVSVHALQEIPFDMLIPVLSELRRVLKPGGVLRLCLPDARKAIDAYVRGDANHFVVPDEDFKSLGGKFIAHMLWYGHSRVMFTGDFIEELLLRTGFAAVEHCRHGQTRSRFNGIIELDNREHESLFVEATK